MTPNDPMGTSQTPMVMFGPNDIRPVPDPTILTVAMLQREIKLLQDKVSADLDAYQLLVKNKFHMIYKVIDEQEKSRLELKEDRIREVRDSQEAQDNSLRRQRELLESKIDAAAASMLQHRTLTDTKFAMYESLRDEQKKDIEKGVETARTAALNALAEFVSRYERAHDELYQRTESSLQQFRAEVHDKFAAAKELAYQQDAASDRAITKSETSVSEQLRLLSEPIGDLKDRIGKLEARRVGASEYRSDSRGQIGMYVAVGGLLLTIIAFVIMNTLRSTATLPVGVSVSP